MARIAVISTTVFPVCPPNGTAGYAGLEVIAYFCAKGLAQRGHQVALIAPEGSSCPGVNIIPNVLHATANNPHYRNESVAYGGDGKQGGWGGYWPALLQFDCIIDHSWSKNSYMLKKEGRLKAPVLGVMHAPVDTMMQSPPPVDKPCVVCISDDQKVHYEALFNRPNGARRAYNGCDVDFYKPTGQPRSDRFLFLARFSTIKGPLIAEQLCVDTGSKLDLVGDTTITNEPEYFWQCKVMADDHPDLIALRGNQTRGNCVWYFSQARALLHTAKAFREPFGLSPVESMLCESPVICFDNGAMRETVRHGETGFVCKTEDDMQELIRSGAVDSLDRKRCREWASRFSLDAMCNRYSELVTEALDGGW